MDATIDPAQLRAFVAVVRSGSFTRAAEALATRKSHLSRLVIRLEARLDAQLLHRTTRSVTVTELGQEVFERAVAILAALEDTDRLAESAKGEPQGVLRLTCGEEFGLCVVSRWIAGYLAAHPKVRVEADFTNRMVDIVSEGYDLAIRVGTLGDGDLTAAKLGEADYALFASPDYLKARNAPKVPRDLGAHETVVFAAAGRSAELKLSRGADREIVRLVPRLLVNNNLAARDAVAAGVGIGLLPRFQAAQLLTEGRIQEVLPGWSKPPAPVHAVFSSTRYPTPKVRAFVDHAKRTFTSMIAVPA
ncbi:LysR family transcriptional regulator [Chenggangzhangella methanolivorans]|uniref:LysR family transcriptional regulator n=1 Tax=Chenggangzhangella methanolivorans TaxID=1437009 RepID=A0A9E6UNG3_9HYPH|nr:LysR family transcriptional regulator [Chenggangzhangella methanolivorans]QZO01066.1 LysR family transcriptional regulator [Chenggangzhangella methanolivorans]